MDRVETETKEVTTSRAWLLDFGRGLQAAVGLHEMSHVLTSPLLFEIPCTPPHCSEVLIFQKRILPILDIPSLLEGQRIIHASNDVIGIAIYQDDPTHPIDYGGLRLATLPTSIYVGDDHSCELPAHKRYWAPPLSVACFQHEGAAIPILNLAYLFTGNIGVY
jgi:hypothetical protein